MTLIEAAKKDVGQRENPDGSFQDKKFAADLLAVGWKPGWTWASLILAKWLMDCKHEAFTLVQANAMGTFRQLQAAGYPVSMVPVVGSLVFWQRIQEGRPIWLGDAGLVCRVVSDVEFYAIQGNTIVAEHRHFIFPDILDGLKVVGFVTV